MKKSLRIVISTILSVVTIGMLFVIYPDFSSLDFQLSHFIVFTILLTYTSTYGIPFSGVKVALVPLVAFSSLIVMGPFFSSFAIIISDILYGFVRHIFKEKVGWSGSKGGGFTLYTATVANITMHIWSMVAAGSVYQALDIQVPVQNVSDLVGLVITGATFITANYLAASLFMLMLGRAYVQDFWNNLRRMLFYELLPMFFAPLVAVTLTDLGIASFIVLALVMMLFAGILRDQVNAHARLERRVLELSSLQEVGQILSTSLDIKEISVAIYRAVCKLMPASNFYLAVYYPETNEISFPAYFENDEKIHRETRVAQHGLTEYVLETRKPLLIEDNVEAKIKSLGIAMFGKSPHSWLGVPILAADEVIGVIAVQSYHLENEIPQSYDKSHQEVLTTIAGQASVAIQNARLYAQTDEALAQRVQELNSILSTAAEGILLLNTDMTVLEVNRALANMLNTTPANISDQNLAQTDNRTLQQLKIEDQVLEMLIAGEIDTHQSEIILSGKTETPVERTITPVLGDSNIITGWLVVYRDLTEELELERVKEDLTRMLVHDLRSPIVSIQGGLDMIEVMINDDDKETLLEMVDISRKGSYLILGMINQLLNLYKMESGSMQLNVEPLALPSLFNEERLQFKTVLQRSDIRIILDFSNDLPVINADHDLMARVVHNLMDNAIKYSENGSEISLWAKPDTENPGHVLFGVSDNGAGIPENVLPALFEKYFTSQQEKARRKGTGLGLYFCKLAVEAHGGKIWAESEQEKGSNFIIRLPEKQ